MHLKKHIVYDINNPRSSVRGYGTGDSLSVDNTSSLNPFGQIISNITNTLTGYLYRFTKPYNGVVSITQMCVII